VHSVSESQRDECGSLPFFHMATSLEISDKRNPDQSSAPKTISFREKFAKIGPAGPEINVLREIIKKEDKN